MTDIYVANKHVRIVRFECGSMILSNLISSTRITPGTDRVNSRARPKLLFSSRGEDGMIEFGNCLTSIGLRLTLYVTLPILLFLLLLMLVDKRRR